MLSWVIQITVISIILIFLVHHLINFFKSTLTVPKIKDLVNTPTQKYENMYNIIQNNLKNSSNNFQIKQNSSEISSLNNDYTLIDLLPKPRDDGSTMKNELKSFLKKQLNSSSNTNIPENSLSMGSYTNY
uniref:Uncharacterized protein n=1 Tax=viral metagenome TaxID=1070528 RepID=A0A6C0AQP7_9ZZZZ